MTTDRTVALVGRPNVGKSRLFNRLARRRIAIVHDQAGVTRDVNSVEIDDDYTLLDTGGIGLVVDMDHQKLIQAAEEQVWFAVEAASVILFVLDAREGLTSLDEIIAERLRASGKSIIPVINKVDNPNMVDRAQPFLSLGFGEGLMISAEHGYGESELREGLDEVLGPRPEKESEAAGERPRIRLAFVGRPNVGKSSICNRLLNDSRLVVSEVPGTTRDSVSLNLDYKASDGQDWPFALVDTAGLRRRGRVSHSIEYFSTLRSHEAVEKADIVFLVIDAETGVTRQDKALAGEIIDSGKCVCVIVNKWDKAIEGFEEQPLKGYETIDDFRKGYGEAALKELFFLPDSPVLFVSAKTGLAIDRVLRMARMLWEISGRSLPTPRLNKCLDALLQKREPKIVKFKRFKIYYAVQIGNRPFRFRLFCNRATKLEEGYKRYLVRGINKAFELRGCPIEFDLKGKTVRYAERNERKR
ncbi:MAG: ribosome biogenesis GTPase Der [Opitutales bacterium]|nr:ribosome biogenesis GTPase Der [Opitutales bacterium]